MDDQSDLEKLDTLRAYFDIMNRGHYQWCHTDGKVKPRDFINQVVEATEDAPSADNRVHMITVMRDNEEAPGLTLALAGFGPNSANNAAGITAILNALPWLFQHAQAGIEASCNPSSLIPKDPPLFVFQPQSRGS